MKRLSVKANFIFSLLNQLVAFISPLIITPYLSRVLGAEAIGQFSFSQSVVQYFIFGATLGITMYAQRCIAEHKNSVEDQSKVFWEIVLLRLIVTSAVLLVYFILSINNVFGSYSLLMNILSINIVACVFDITFFFQGNEHFSTIVISTILFRVLSLVLSFLLIKTPDDIVIYTGYNLSELEEKVELLSYFDNIIIKFGRYIPNQQAHHDDILGVNLASDNQYAIKIS